jgi:O-acetyl-ADP-ribose deacetylase (regulator of RNase III)
MTQFSVKFGDILSIDHGIIVHGCNSHGVMGSGLAAQIKAKYPRCFSQYKDYCERWRTEKNPAKSILGNVVVYQHSADIIIMNAITQEDFGRSGKRYVDYQAISNSFANILRIASEIYKYHIVNYPLIGAGLGGGEWSIISEILNSEFSKYPEISRALWLLDK